MPRSLLGTLVGAFLCGAFGSSPAAAQTLASAERVALDAWYRSATERTGGHGQWGVAIGTMDGRILWSVSPELALIPASTAKLFTTGFTRARVGGDSRLTTRVVGDGVLDSATGRWQGKWALELGGIRRSIARAGAGRRCASWPGGCVTGACGSSRARSRS